MDGDGVSRDMGSPELAMGAEIIIVEPSDGGGSDPLMALEGTAIKQMVVVAICPEEAAKHLGIVANTIDQIVGDAVG